MSGTRCVSPPKAWLFALALALPIPLPLLFPWTIVETTDIEGANEYHYRRELADYLNAGREEEHRSKGVMLAMSGGSCATVGPLRLSTNGVDMYVVFYSLATLATFHGLVDVLVDGNPDFIAIQDTILVMTPHTQSVRSLYSQARSHWTRQLYGFARRLNAQEIDLVVNDSWRCDTNPKPRSMWASHVQRAMARMSPYSERRHTEVVKFLNKFVAAGIPVIIASPPMNNYTAKYRLEVFQAASEIVHTDPPLSTVSLHRQSILMPTAHFDDPLHLSSEANQPYRVWLNNEIIHVLRVQERQ